MSGDLIEGVCLEILEARRERRLTEERVFDLGRRLTRMAGLVCMERPNYCPEDDRRVLWARKVLAGAIGNRAEVMDAALEATALMLIGEAVTPAVRGAVEYTD